MAVTGEYGYTPGYNAIWGGGIYPGMGDTVGMVSGISPDVNPPLPGASNPGAQNSNNPFMGNPIGGFVVLVVLVVAIMLTVHRFGRAEGDFANLKASFYNVFIIALVAVTGIPLVKFVSLQLAAWKIPGMDHVSAYVMGA